MSQKVTLSEKLAEFSDHFAPRTVAEFNGHDIMVVKLSGPFIWHKHDETDDFFLVLKGTLDIELRDKTVTLGPGEMYVVPKGANTDLWPMMRYICSSSSPQARPTPVTRKRRPHAG
jgi:mannose-6-phosphate isomerase-like protein (cupin superfamily)